MGLILVELAMQISWKLHSKKRVQIFSLIATNAEVTFKIGIWVFVGFI